VYRIEEVKSKATTTPVTPIKTSKTAPVSVVNAKSDRECSPSENVELNKLLVKYFKNCKDVKIIWAIAQAESSGKQLAVNKGNTNKSWDCGYMQNNTIHRKADETKEQFCERMFNLEENIATAHKIYKEAGNKFTPWVTFNKSTCNLFKIMKTIKEYLEQYPTTRERSNKDRFLATVLKEKYKVIIDTEILTEIVKDYDSMNRVWRKVTADNEHLRGLDYNDKKHLQEKKIIELGYRK
jgi:hypothetical protein